MLNQILVLYHRALSIQLLDFFDRICVEIRFEHRRLNCHFDTWGFVGKHRDSGVFTVACFFDFSVIDDVLGLSDQSVVLHEGGATQWLVLLIVFYFRLGSAVGGNFDAVLGLARIFDCEWVLLRWFLNIFCVRYFFFLVTRSHRWLKIWHRLRWNWCGFVQIWFLAESSWPTHIEAHNWVGCRISEQGTFPQGLVCARNQQWLLCFFVVAATIAHIQWQFIYLLDRGSRCRRIFRLIGRVIVGSYVNNLLCDVNLIWCCAIRTS